MKTQAHQAAQIGDLIAAAFDEAARYSADPEDVSRMATHVVTRMLRHARRIDTNQTDELTGWT